jgi:hypothetical protein
MNLMPSIRTMDAFGRLVHRLRPQGWLGTVEQEGRCL